MNKKFDCVEMKHKGARRLLQKLSGLSTKQELEFWHKQTKVLIEHRKKITNQLKKAKPGLSKKS